MLYGLRVSRACNGNGWLQVGTFKFKCAALRDQFGAIFQNDRRMCRLLMMLTIKADLHPLQCVMHQRHALG